MEWCASARLWLVPAATLCKHKRCSGPERFGGTSRGKAVLTSCMNARILEKHVAVVTGASSGIGEATARTLAAQGAAVVLAARRGDRLKTIGESIRHEGGICAEVVADITMPDDAQRMIDTALESFGRLDILVNNAGVMLLGPIVDARRDEWERMISLNLSALLTATHIALPHLLKAAADGPRGVADIVNISSVAGRIARLNNGVYNATKFGVTAFSESLRQEVTKRHVRVSLVEPGAVETELASHNNPEMREALRKRFDDIGERLQPQDIADAVEYVVTRPRHVAINEILIRPTQQEI